MFFNCYEEVYGHMGAFELLSDPIRKLLVEAGINEPTDIQEGAIPVLLKGANALLISPTGSGKTEAALLPLFDLMLREGRGGIKTIYITPLRALNRDLLDRISWWARRLDFRVSVRHGDTPKAERAQQVSAPPDLLITTPETLQIILVARRLRELLKGVKHVIVDEVHELVDDKRGTQLAVSLKRLEAISGKFQVIGLSATVGNRDEVAKFLVGEGNSCEVVEVFPKKMFEFKVIYHRGHEEGGVLYPDLEERLKIILNELKGRKGLIFTNTRSEAESLISKLRIVDPTARIAVHHGSLSVNARSGAELGLKRGDLTGVVCTSSLELGIDIGDLDVIIQYNSPRQATKLIQRAGRSGHSLKKVSRGVIVVQDSDDALEAGVLARRALQGWVEPINIPKEPLDVMMQQIAGLIMERTVIKEEDALRIFRSTYPYRHVSEDKIREVAEYMQDRRPSLLRVREGAFMKPQRTGPLYEYYFTNLSMIPEEATYVVVDEEGNFVGQLDEEFVSEYGEIGTKFVLAGMAWVITQVSSDKVYVRHADDPLGAIPSWIGEEIPVVREVAEEVGKIRGELAELLKAGKPEEAVKRLMELFPMDEESALNALSEINEQVKLGYPVPTDKIITVEGFENYVVLAIHGGLILNRTLSRVLAYLASKETGKSVNAKADPYRVVLEFPSADPGLVENLLKGLAGMDIEGLVKEGFEDTGIFRRRLIHAARKMGAVSPKAMITLSDAKLLASSLKGTAVYDEAMRTMLEEDVELKGLAQLARAISDGSVRVVNLGRLASPTPISMIGLSEMARQGEVVDPARLRRLIIEGAKARTMSCSKTLYCFSCGSAYGVVPYFLGDPPRCERCGSTDVALVDESEDELLVKLADKDYVKKLEAIRELIAEFGKKGAISLCFNVPLDRVKKVIADKEDDKLYLALMEAERRRTLKLE